MTGATAGDERTEALVPFTGLRGAVARAMSAAWEAPRVAIAVDVRVDALSDLRARRQEQVGVTARLSPTHFVLRAAALALREHPGLNGEITSDGVRLRDSIDIGLAVNMPDGVLVPVLREVDTKTVESVAEEAAGLAEYARAGTLKPSALRGATFTFSTLGATGIDWFTPILNPPQIAILGAGAIVRRPIVDGDDVVIASMMTLTLVFDHRATDGHPAALFLAAVRKQIELPCAL
jgi:pyruvate/2-oxoglutarate dehydrogenase complex dihydrolipoamide acyltransferase (E2) component